MAMIELVNYDPEWENKFLSEKIKLKKVLGEMAVAIEHIGSTAIPGMMAKPVIDIMIGVNDLRQFDQGHIDLIESLGYQYIQSYEKQMPYRRFFLKNDENQNRTHHIHLINYPSAWWKRHILFRDYLKKQDSDAKKYENLKLKLAEAINNHSLKKYLSAYPELVKEYQRMQKILGDDFTIGNQYALGKSLLIQDINEKAYFDFDLHQPEIVLTHLKGYIPQMVCFKIYKKMFQDPDFIRCFGVTVDDKRIREILERDMNHWDQNSFGPYVWFDKKNNVFVGEGGLNPTLVEGCEEIELTYSLNKQYWGKGLAVEIGQFAIDYGFNTLQLDNIVCFTMAANTRSLRVIEKLGFQYEKDFTHRHLPHKLFRLQNPNN